MAREILETLPDHLKPIYAAAEEGLARATQEKQLSPVIEDTESRGNFFDFSTMKACLQRTSPSQYPKAWENTMELVKRHADCKDNNTVQPGSLFILEEPDRETTNGDEPSIYFLVDRSKCSGFPRINGFNFPFAFGQKIRLITTSEFMAKSLMGSEINGEPVPITNAKTQETYTYKIKPVSWE